MRGYQDNEMMARWTWFGVFSPIMRLHCSSSIFNGKEPWRYGMETEKSMGEALRLRHRMMPYLYTMNYRSYEEDLPLVCPMYYEHPEDGRAYEVPNQYYFGSELLVVPITSERIAKLHVAGVRAFLPEGLWYDIFTGQLYHGDRMMEIYRDINSIPVLARAGTILPLTDNIYGSEVSANPKSLCIRVYGGADGSFTLYEDDNETCDYEAGICARTRMVYEDKKRFVVYPVMGEDVLLPERRDYQVEFFGYKPGIVPVVCLDGEVLTDRISWEYVEKERLLRVRTEEIPVCGQLEISFVGAEVFTEDDRKARVFDFLSQAEIGFELKEEIYRLVCEAKDRDSLWSGLMAKKPDRQLLEVLTELITG